MGTPDRDHAQSGQPAGSGAATCIELLQQSGEPTGDLLFLTDGISDEALRRLLESHRSEYPVSVLGIGTAEGEPDSARGGRLRAG